jgi:CheY-like chemotaxis protein
MPVSSSHDILLVHGHAGECHDLTLLLERRGYSVATVAHGSQAVEFLRQHPSPRLILLELAMETPAGWQLLTARHRDSALAHVPFVVLSTAGQSLRCPALALGADDVLDKPIDADDLLTVVGRYC